MSFLPGMIGSSPRSHVLPTPSGGYSFTMTAGALDILRGYEGDLVGSIDAEPIPGHPVVFLLSSQLGGAQFAVLGDAVALLTGKTVWIDEVEYVDGWSGWSLEEPDPETLFTFCSWASGHEPVFEDDGVYFVEIK